MKVTRQDVLDILVELPRPERPITAELVCTEDAGNYVLERLVLDLNGYERVPALFCRPKTGAEPFPAVLFNHSHGGMYHIGKSELLTGCDYMQKPGYGPALAEAGIASLAIDHLCFEERSGRTESFVFKKLLWEGRWMWSQMVFDSLRALDYLCSRPDVDNLRVGTLGMSMGSSMAQWVAALDGRVKACADLCCLCNYQELLAENRLDLHGIYYYIPGLLNRLTTAALNALTAPRPHLCLVGEHDLLTPARAVARDELEIARAYESLGAPQNWRLRRYPVGHLETREMRRDVLEFLKEQL